MGDLEFPIKLSPSLIHLTPISLKSKWIECVELWLFKFSAVEKGFFFSFVQFHKILGSGLNPLQFTVFSEENYYVSWEKFLCLQFTCFKQAKMGSSNTPASPLCPVFISRPRSSLSEQSHLEVSLAPGACFHAGGPWRSWSSFQKREFHPAQRILGDISCSSLAKLKRAHFNWGLLKSQLFLLLVIFNAHDDKGDILLA